MLERTTFSKVDSAVATAFYGMLMVYTMAPLTAVINMRVHHQFQIKENSWSSRFAEGISLSIGCCATLYVVPYIAENTVMGKVHVTVLYALGFIGSVVGIITSPLNEIKR